MKITAVIVRKRFPTGPLKAIVSVVLDDCFTIHDIKVVQTKEKRFLVMPSRKGKMGDRMDVFHPITPDFRDKLQEAIFHACDDLPIAN